MTVVGLLPPSKGFRYILTIVDRFSSWPEAIPLPDITAQSVVDAFVLHFVGRYGAPETITTDRGRQFTSTLWHDLMTFLGSKIIHTTKANGIVERFHRVLKASLKAHTNPSDWFSNLGWVLLGIHSMVNENHPYSFSEVLYGTSLRLPGEYFHLSEKSHSPSSYIFFLYLFIFILHSRESELYRYILGGTSALAWELPFLRCLGHLCSTKRRRRPVNTLTASKFCWYTLTRFIVKAHFSHILPISLTTEKSKTCFEIRHKIMFKHL